MSFHERPPPLELLVRQSDRVIIQVVESNRAFLGMRPRVVKGLELEQQEVETPDGVRHVLHNRKGSQYLQLTDEEHYIWSLIDGQTSMQSLATALFLRSGHLDPMRLQQFLQGARKAGLIELTPNGAIRSRLTEQGLLRRWMDADWRNTTADPWFQKLYGWFRPFRFALPMLVGLSVWGAWRRLALGPSIAGIGWWLALFPAIVVGVIVHELAHGIACASFGRKIRAIGVSFEHLLPSPYVDTTDMFLATPRQHALVALAGPAASLLLAGVAGLSPWLDPLPEVSLAIGLLSFWPFFPFDNDGYQALTDLLVLPMLRRRAWKWLRNWESVSPALRWRFFVYLSGALCTPVLLALWVFWFNAGD